EAGVQAAGDGAVGVGVVEELIVVGVESRGGADEGEVLPAGAGDARPVDVRLIRGDVESDEPREQEARLERLEGSGNGATHARGATRRPRRFRRIARRTASRSAWTRCFRRSWSFARCC